MENSSDRDKILTLRNYPAWITRLTLESIGYYGMHELLTNLKELDFKVEEVDIRLPAVLTGTFATKTGNIKEGYQVNDKGEFMNLSERAIAILDKLYVEKVKEMSGYEKIYKANKKTVN